jgi:nitroreductase
MKFLELAKKRYSARSYQNKPVEAEKIHEILEAGRVAPTACNNQPQKILVIQTPEGIAKITKGYRAISATTALIICADHQESWRRSYDGKDSSDIDAAIITDHMMLCATELGLDSVWICAFNPSIIQEEFDIPDHVEPVNILLIGYAACDPQSPERHDKMRKPLEHTVFYEKF